MSRFALDDQRPCRLFLTRTGPHRFGGPAVHEGIVPVGASVPLHLVLLLDLEDQPCPVRSDGLVRHLPLYYPLKYGFGGPAVQYRVASDSRIDILYLSDPTPDADEHQYVRVPELPSSPAEIVPDPGRDRSIVVGGSSRLPVNAGDVTCRNPACARFERRVEVDVIASVPPVAVGGTDDFWHEYQGGDFEFYFCLCRHCTTVIAFNVAS